MDFKNLKETVERIALDALVPPEICVVTRDKRGFVHVWWSETAEVDKAETCQRVFDDLTYDGERGPWYIPGSKRSSKNVMIGQSDIKIAFCSMYSEIDYCSIDLGEMAVSSMVTELLNRISESSKVADEPEIVTLYRADGIVFDTHEEAQNHLKAVKLFNLFLESHPDADYMENEGLIKFMIANPEKFIDILKV